MPTDNQNLEGIIVPMITPLNSSLELDVKGTDRLIDRMLFGGVHGIFILGTTGEASSLKPTLKKYFIEVATNEISGQVPVLVGITHTSFDVSLRMARQAKENGATAVVAAPPYYFPLDQQDLYAYYIHLANQSALPLYLYNYPAMTKCTLELDTVRKLAKHNNILGIKDSSGNGIYFQKLLNLKTEFPDFTVLVGPEEITAQAILSGADGGINGGGNIFPSLYVRMFEAAKEKNLTMLEKIQQIILDISTTIYGCSNKPYSYFYGVKESLYYLGICEPYLAPPMQPADMRTREKIRENLEKIIFDIKSL